MLAGSPVSQLDEKKLVSCVSDVTAAICGIKFMPGSLVEGDAWIAACLPIKGGVPITIALLSDESCSRALAAGMLQMEPHDLDRLLIEDTLREILNMVAGQVKTALNLDQALGLPTIVAPAELNNRLANGSRRIGLASGPLSLMLALAPGP
ncbi:MAG: chemotaxis protein CheX [Deltaproteobacteria bacterium]|nr:chemotaxis protein CheX [Deltaproteobacteria bacterium]